MREIVKRLNFFVIAIIVLVLLVPFLAFQTYHVLLQAPAKSGEAQIFVVKPGDPVQTIAKNLEEKKLIKNSLAFRLLISRMGIGKSIEAGDFRISPAMSAQEVATILTHGAIDVWVTIPEGYRNEQIAETLNSRLGIDKDEFIKKAQEGYMFPDTYLIPTDSSVGRIVLIMRQNFDTRVGDKLKNASSKYSPEELLTLASIVERESRTDEERPQIAGVLINRLNIGMALQADATVQYVLGKNTSQSTWWPTVEKSDYKTKSPYNTYAQAGLPPGPIANPGLASINAVANPTKSDYLYYLHDSKGQVYFAKTLEEHNANIAKHL